MDYFEFEWDERKREANLTKHGVDFVRAVDVFFDESRIELESGRADERRYQAIGEVDDNTIILLVYTHRADKKRIISARMASRKERKLYYGDNYERSH